MNREEFEDRFIFYPLSELFVDTRISNESIKKNLRSFSCERNKDVQDFLKSKAYSFEKRDRSRTYLYIDEDSGNIAAYFTIALSILHAQDVDKSIFMLLGGFPDLMSARDIPHFLIAQLGKNDRYKELKIGRHLLDDALDIVDGLHKQIGGRFVLLDAFNHDRLLTFYKNAGFFPIQDPSSQDDSVKMIRPYFDMEPPYQD